MRTRPNSVAAQLFREFPAPSPLAGAGSNRYANQSNVTIDGVTMPATGSATVNLRDYIRFDQYLVRIDHSFRGGLDKLTGRWIGEHQRDEGGTSSSTATLGQASRGMRGPFRGSFGNLNLGTYASSAATSTTSASPSRTSTPSAAQTTRWCRR
jgi:hypothetical protein